MHGIVGRAWCYDRRYVYTTTDDLTCIIIYKHNTLYVLSVQATVVLHEPVNGILETYQYVMKAGKQ